MSDPTDSSTFVDLGEKFTWYFLPPLSILTVCGAFKRLRNPWIRGTAFAFTATTQALWERDLQIEHRRALVRQAQSWELRNTTWLFVQVFSESFRGETSGVSWPLETEGKKDDECDCCKVKELQDKLVEIDVWDSSHGEREIQHRIDTLYSSKAIFFKSLACGITLGTLPLLLKAPVFVTDLWNYSTEKEKLINRLVLGIKTEDSFNRCYAWSVGSRPFLDPSHWAIINWMHMFAVNMYQDYLFQQGWLPKPKRWYSRKGKLPIFQYNIEEESC